MIIKKILRALVAGNFLHRVFRRIGRLFKWAKLLRQRLDFAIGYCARRIMFRKGAIEENKIFAMTYDSAFTCNPRYIIEELLRQELPVQIVLVVPPQGVPRPIKLPKEIKLVGRGTYRMFVEMATSKVWIDNALNCVWYGMPKKENQVLINTWHGSMGIKRLGGNRTWLRRARRCNKLTDYCISNSTFEENVYRETFWKDVPILPYGHPRNDILFDPEKRAEMKAKIFDALGLSSDVRTLLYAPTFRDDGNADAFNVDYARLKETLEQKFGGNWVILVRMHFKNRTGNYSTIHFNRWLINASLYPDMQELLAVADIGMTDYSSWAYDYVLTRNPLFLYTADIEKYDQQRGFYYPLEETPFAIARTNDELEQAIRSFDPEAYDQRVTAFLADKGCYENGDASRRTVEKLKEIMKL